MQQAMAASPRADRFLARVKDGEIVFEKLTNWYEEYPGKLEIKHLTAFKQLLESQTGRVMGLVLEARNATGQI